MKEHLSIEAPEQIELNYDIAGIGSRFCAASVDTALIAIVSIIGISVTSGALSDILGERVGNWIIAVRIFIIFAFFWSYYIIFDLISNGQSPGKRLIKLRVIKADGYPINFADSAIRNILRIIDFLPIFYFVGILTMMIDKKWRRLGDLAAGTLVIKEHTELTSDQLIPHISNKTHLTYTDIIQLDQVTTDDLATIREYLSRRSRLQKSRKVLLAQTIARPIAQKMGIKTRIDYDVFLEELFIKSNTRKF